MLTSSYGKIINKNTKNALFIWYFAGKIVLDKGAYGG